MFWEESNAIENDDTISFHQEKKTIQFSESISAKKRKTVLKIPKFVHCLFFHRKVLHFAHIKYRRQYRLQFQSVKLFTLLLNSYGSTKSMHEISMKIMLCSHNVSLAHKILRSNKNVARLQCILRVCLCVRTSLPDEEKRNGHKSGEGLWFVEWIFFITTRRELQLFKYYSLWSLADSWSVSVLSHM